MSPSLYHQNGERTLIKSFGTLLKKFKINFSECPLGDSVADPGFPERGANP